MKLYQQLILKNYVKSFLVIFLSLEIFFTGIDLMQNFKHLPDSANLQILYTTNIFLNFINFTLPLSLLFAMVSTMMKLIKSNQLVALYSVGTSKSDVIKPIFFLSLFIILGYISLQNTNFVRSAEIADNIKKHGVVTDNTHGLFLKSDHSYIYIKELNPIDKTATGIKIFKIKEKDLQEIIHAKKGSFSTNRWNLKDVIDIQLIGQNNKKIVKSNHTTMSALSGFEPHIVNSLFKGKGKLTIKESINAINFLESQSLNSDKIRATLFYMILFPLFVPIVMLALFYPLPAQRRGKNLTLINSAYILSILLLWGVMFSLSKISLNGALSPYLGIALPIFILFLISLYLVCKNR